MRRPGIFTVIALFCCMAGFAQDKDTLVKKLDSLSKLPDSANIRRESYNELTRMSGHTYLILLGNDVTQQFAAPFHIKRKDLPKIAAFGLVFTTVLVSDRDIQIFARELNGRNPQIASVSDYVTRFGAVYEVYTLGGLAAYGFLFRNKKIQTTTLLATQAYLTSMVMFELGKFLSGRQRPNYTDPLTNDVAHTFHGPFYQFKKNAGGVKPANNSHTSFPSGHTTLAFAAATVYAMEYRDRPLVPIIAYSAASLVGLTRITENKHWASDVLMGAVLGHLCGRQVVNNYHRYQRLRQAGKNPNTVSFSMQYMHGQLLPGIVYHIN